MWRHKKELVALDLKPHKGTLKVTLIFLFNIVKFCQSALLSVMQMSSYGNTQKRKTSLEALGLHLGSIQKAFLEDKLQSDDDFK